MSPWSGLARRLRDSRARLSSTVNGRWRVVNTTREGRLQAFDDPVFHGGPGTTLEMRQFSRTALIRHLEQAGFTRIRIADEPCATSGIAWPQPFSVPMVAYAQ
ncbi:MAG TPA: hypothetical protein VKU81_06495 [Casimicrobiaceae bacterium]|nr:hypothetical protein [Casimicrobiaceae bacterium]